jgi:hypothetical protein
VSLFPLARFEQIEALEGDRALRDWGHYLGANDRPFGRQDFGLFVDDDLVAVAVSASTVGATCAGFDRFEVVELARLVRRPDARWCTRVALRLWREIAPTCWRNVYRDKWPHVRAVVSYSNETRHRGDIYRFDGWQKFGVNRGSTGGGGYTKVRETSEAKAVWFYPLEVAA